jgi:hypothetical protein
MMANTKATPKPILKPILGTKRRNTLTSSDFVGLIMFSPKPAQCGRGARGKFLALLVKQDFVLMTARNKTPLAQQAD